MLHRITHSTPIKSGTTANTRTRRQSNAHLSQLCRVVGRQDAAISASALQRRGCWNKIEYTHTHTHNASRFPNGVGSRPTERGNRNLFTFDFNVERLPPVAGWDRPAGSTVRASERESRSWTTRHWDRCCLWPLRGVKVHMYIKVYYMLPIGRRGGHM